MIKILQNIYHHPHKEWAFVVFALFNLWAMFISFLDSFFFIPHFFCWLPLGASSDHYNTQSIVHFVIKMFKVNVFTVAASDLRTDSQI